MKIRMYTLTENLAQKFIDVLKNNGFTFNYQYARSDEYAKYYTVAVIVDNTTEVQVDYLFYSI